jgi:hypothetical protein
MSFCRVTRTCRFRDGLHWHDCPRSCRSKRFDPHKEDRCHQHAGSNPLSYLQYVLYVKRIEPCPETNNDSDKVKLRCYRTYHTTSCISSPLGAFRNQGEAAYLQIKILGKCINVFYYGGLLLRSHTRPGSIVAKKLVFSPNLKKTRLKLASQVGSRFGLS